MKVGECAHAGGEVDGGTAVGDFLTLRRERCTSRKTNRLTAPLHAHRSKRPCASNRFQSLNNVRRCRCAAFHYVRYQTMIMYGIKQKRKIVIKTLSHHLKSRAPFDFICSHRARKLSSFLRYPQQSPKSSAKPLHKRNSIFEFDELSLIYRDGSE